MDGTRLWRIDLGPNVRSGAATTNFWSLILMEMDVRKFVVKREMVLSMDWDIG